MASAFFTKPAEPDCDLTAWWGSYAGHKGLDYGWRFADPDRTRRVYAAYEGTAVSVYAGGDYNEGWGNRVIIEHAPGVRTTYNHLATGTILVAQGQRVGTGQHIATMGDTGRVSGVHLHWELYIDGVRVDPRPYREGLPIPRVEVNALQPHQRKVLAGVQARRRAESNTQSASKDPVLAGGEVGDFNGWQHGEAVEGNDVWFRGLYSNDWFWSGSFEGGANTAGLPEVPRPQAPAASGAQRIVGTDAMARRTGPGTNYPKADGDPLAPGTVGNFVAFARGERVTVGGISSDIWYKGTSGDFFAAAGFTSQDTAGLPEVTVAGTPSTPPAPADKPDDAYKRFTPDSTLAKWIGSPNYNYRAPRPAGAKPTHVTMHWMAGTLAGTDAQFQQYDKLVDGRGDGSAATYGVGQTEVHQYVREQDYQQADGNTESNRWGLSIEHEAGPNSPASAAVMAKSAQLLADIAHRYGWASYEAGKNIFPHKHWVATDCPGTLDIDAIVKAANLILNPPKPENPKPGEPTVTVPRNWLERLLADLSGLLGKR